MIPKKLAERRDELEIRKWIDKVLNSTSEALAFHEGFNAACAILLPEMEKMKKALETCRRITIVEFINDDDLYEHERLILEALQSYKEVMGDD